MMIIILEVIGINTVIKGIGINDAIYMIIGLMCFPTIYVESYTVKICFFIEIFWNFH